MMGAQTSTTVWGRHTGLAAGPVERDVRRVLNLGSDEKHGKCPGFLSGFHLGQLRSSRNLI